MTPVSVPTSTGYDPVRSNGARRDHVFAFVRTHDAQQVLVAVPRLVATLVPDGDVPPIGARVWGDTRLDLPPGSPRMYRHVRTGDCIRARVEGDRAELALAEVFARFPVACLEGR